MFERDSLGYLYFSFIALESILEKISAILSIIMDKLNDESEQVRAVSKKAVKI